jgi:hypothetical protein
VCISQAQTHGRVERRREKTNNFTFVIHQNETGRARDDEIVIESGNLELMKTRGYNHEEIYTLFHAVCKGQSINFLGSLS